MLDSKMIKDIVFLTTKFYNSEDYSMYFLLKETGYFESQNYINEKNIYDCLLQYPNCINHWLEWSENKRSTSGWYFKIEDNNSYIVGYFPDTKNLKPIKYFDIIEACANFILKEIEEIKGIN